MKNILKTLAKTGCADIITALSKQKFSFNKIAKMVDYPSTATRRLNELIEIGIVKRIVLQNKRRSVEYELSPKGKDIAEILIKLRQIGSLEIAKRIN
ncbi:MAG: winged helix-turn-helix transcriptional regulator [Candidatus Thermoplasmatota archaeon]|nr:winged helix-turn-helix transcriptional regulator [Candidatus Thermoplasmatota archaeon]MBU4256603.1 winged helix-turn-helix transcriptional regulator [Candidatus Thermoplasmatota archaeon]MCG2827601.1 winged helix-turn-helix transcriptional regulator [Thermoplasmatales archaeon]